MEILSGSNKNGKLLSCKTAQVFGVFCFRSSGAQWAVLLNWSYGWAFCCTALITSVVLAKF